MAEEEFRKVAEDMRALARSLAKDFRQAADHARFSGHPLGRAYRQAFRGIADNARRDFGRAWGDPRQPRRSGHPWWGWPPPGPGGPPPDGLADPVSGDPASGDPAAEGPGGRGPGSGGAPSGGPAPGGRDARSYGPWPFGFGGPHYGRGRYRAPGPWSCWPGPSRGPAGNWAGPDRYGGRPRPARPARPPRRQPPAPPPVRRRWDAPALIGLLGGLFATAWLLGALHAIHVPAEGVFAVGLMLLGSAMVVTARTDWSLSRHSWPVLVGGGLISVLILTSSAFGLNGILRHVTFGDVAVRATPGQTVYGGFGNLTVDATGLSAGQHLSVESVVGDTVIRVQRVADVRLSGRLLAGETRMQTRLCGGAPVQPPVPPDPATSVAFPPQLNIDVHQLAGQVNIFGEECPKP